MVLKVGILGVTGKMGQEVASLLHTGYTVADDSLEFSEALARSKTISSVDGVPVKNLLQDEFDPVHVWIDFSQPEGTLTLMEKTKEPVVVCTTGFTALQLERLEGEASRRAVLIAPNTSPGINFVLSMLEVLPQVSKLGFDVFIEEAHHIRKQDKPSGTAKLINRVLEENGNKALEVHSVRAGGEKGRHRISFTAQEEEFVLEHRVFDRSVFAKGALLAAHFLAQQKPGLYTMKDVWRKYHG